MLVPVWYWWVMAAAIVAARDSGDLVVQAITIPLAVLVMAVLTGVMIPAVRRRVQVHNATQPGARGAAAIFGMIVLVDGVIVATAIGLAAAHAAYPATIGTPSQPPRPTAESQGAKPPDLRRRPGLAPSPYQCADPLPAWRELLLAIEKDLVLVGARRATAPRLHQRPRRHPGRRAARRRARLMPPEGFRFLPYRAGLSMMPAIAVTGAADCATAQHLIGLHSMVLLSWARQVVFPVRAGPDRIRPHRPASARRFRYCSRRPSVTTCWIVEVATVASLA